VLSADGVHGADVLAINAASAALAASPVAWGGSRQTYQNV